MSPKAHVMGMVERLGKPPLYCSQILTQQSPVIQLLLSSRWADTHLPVVEKSGLSKLVPQ